VADLAEAPATAATAQAVAPPPSSTTTPASEQTATKVSGDPAKAFSDVEEDFFRAGQKTARPPSSSDSFDDLDEGYKPVGFWGRLLGRKPKPKKR
jgi:hypothetical protein